ncbi:MAG: PAS domain S-box protein [Acidobacteriia bacterium]|nr:PAS domain S-box protein [Terriglobia bacterium]
MAKSKKNGASQKPAGLSRRELLVRLHEAETTLHAIRSGEVDAIVVEGPGGEKVFTLEGADHIYRVFVERMNEGAAVLSSDHTVLHCNNRFAQLLGSELQSVIGSSMEGVVWPDDLARFNALLRSAGQKPCRGEIHLQSQDGARLPVRLSLNPLRQGGTRTVCMIAMDLSEVHRAEQELRTSNRQLRVLAAHLLSVREEERTRIAREIHDELGQSLTAVKIDLSWIASRMSSLDIPTLSRIRSTLQLADNLIKSVRKISTELRPGILDMGLAAAMEWQVHDFQARTGIQSTLILLTREVFAPDVSTTVFRILQETLTNVARHAGATRVQVVKRKRRGHLVLTVRDNGRGFDPAAASASKSLGLVGMRERAAMLGGKVEVSSAPGKGASVNVWIPLLSVKKRGATA